MAALNTRIILHSLTVSLHIRLKVWPGNVQREREFGEEGSFGGKVMEELTGSSNDHTLLSHSSSASVRPRSPFCSFLWPLTSFSLLSLPPFVPSVFHNWAGLLLCRLH